MIAKGAIINEPVYYRNDDQTPERSKKLTQLQLAEKIGVSDKAISKWETGRGYPDIALMEPLAGALGVSVIELISGETAVNSNRAFNMLRMKLYVCPICGNVIQAQANL